MRLVYGDEFKLGHKGNLAIHIKAYFCNILLINRRHLYAVALGGAVCDQ